MSYNRELKERVQAESRFVDDLFAEVGKVIVGQPYMVERILIGLLAGGHVLLEGVPGLAKTLTVKHALRRDPAGKFARIQFTPDLLPADLVGTVIYNHQDGDLHPKKGPVFANLVLADEINRAPAKVQSALLEAMQEGQVTIGDTDLPAARSVHRDGDAEPHRAGGHLPLPEAQVDRFMLMVKVGYPTREEERAIMDRQTGSASPAVTAKVTPEQIVKARGLMSELYVDDKVKDYIVSLVFATREPAKANLKDLAGMIKYGASPRATIALNMAARARAFLQHREYVTPEDVKAIALDVLRHRVSLSYEAEAEEITSDQVVGRVLEAIEVP
jgi:MoxR-like ATPase